MTNTDTNTARFQVHVLSNEARYAGIENVSAATAEEAERKAIAQLNAQGIPVTIENVMCVGCL